LEAKLQKQWWRISRDDLSKNNTILSCVKHFALYGAPEAGRDYNTVDMSRIECMIISLLQSSCRRRWFGYGIFQWSWRNSRNGNKWLMTDVLRKQWGFGVLW
jgi:beta-glucosidase